MRFVCAPGKFVGESRRRGATEGRAHRGGRIELRMSSVCVICGFASTGGSFFPGFAAPFFAAPPFFEVNNEGVSYLTRECSGGPGMSLKLTRLLADAGLRERS